jgi:hypothetical protein
VEGESENASKDEKKDNNEVIEEERAKIKELVQKE